ncbi:MAG: pyridoxal-phosphate dependent enzyme, partial [Planctomycetes bacterium]|nr:pyridoxal-phosphate dependent enzyme [Planctomycetota bacterium]
LVEQRAQEIVTQRDAFRADQFALDGNFNAHYLHTGPEFIQQSGGIIEGYCDFLGSGGTFAGCATAFKEYNAAIQCYAIEPQGVAVLAGKEIIEPNHRIQGGGYARTELKNLNDGLIDGYIEVSDQQAIAAARLLAHKEGIFAGFSSGANIAAALQLLRGPLKGKVVATMINDSGLKYLSTDLWAECAPS